MYNSTYKLLTVRDFELFLKGEFAYPTFYITRDNNGSTEESIVNHPYFKNYISLTLMFLNHTLSP